MKSRLCSVLATLVAICAGPATAANLTFSDAIALVSRESPELAAKAEQLEAVRQAAVPAGALPDPKLVVGIDNVPLGADRFSLSRDFMTMQRFGVMQEFPSRAKRAARVAAGQGLVAAAQAQSDVSRIAAIRQTAIAWIARDAAEKQLAQMESFVAENVLFEATTRARIVSGLGLATEAVAARQEAAMIDERRDELRARVEQALATLRQWLGSAAQSPLAGEPPDWSIDNEGLLHTLQQHPEFAVFDAQALVLNAGIAEAQAAKRPDWSMEVAYQKRGPQFSDMVSLQFTVDLPIFTRTRQSPLIAAQRAQRRALDSAREVGLREHVQQLESGLAEYRRLLNAVQRQRDVLMPLADEKALLAMADWRGGKSSVTQVIVARLERIDAGLKLTALEGQRRQLAASLHYTYSRETGEQP
jgi:outer membrane protein, heavy metal efflux system